MDVGLGLPRVFLVLLFLLGISLEAVAQSSVNVIANDNDPEWMLVASYREGLHRAEQLLEQQIETIAQRASNDKWLLNQSERDVFRAIWQNIIEYYIALDIVAQRHQETLFEGGDFAGFQLSYSLLLIQYASALRIIREFEKHPEIGVVLNEVLPDSPLPEGSYDKFKFKYLNIVIATRFTAAMATYHLTNAAKQSRLSAVIAEDEETILSFGKGRGESMTLANGLRILNQSGQKFLFPIQAEVAEWMGDTKVLRNNKNLISAEQIAALGGMLEPGDILLERREWYLSNVGLPGFWSHAALYIGTAGERKRYFGDDSLEHSLQQRYPVAYQASQKKDNHAATYRILEAISEGVGFSTLEHSASADSVVVLRPRLSKSEKARALLRAFSYVGRPYDFNFDFQTDRELVCTELVYKAYQPEPGYKGLDIPLQRVLGRLALPANALAKLYDEEADSEDRKFEMVHFLDGSEYEQRAVVSSSTAFRGSWRRQKWHVLVSR